jgi:two-component system cell cycle response regulator
LGRYADAAKTTKLGGPVAVEYRLVGYDDVVRWVLDRRWPWPADANGQVGFDGVVSDVTALHERVEALQQKLRDTRAENRRLAHARAEAERRARTDDLTGLFNRRHLTSVLARYLGDAAAANRGVGLLLIDIDFFKQVNDEYGHAAGDQLLVAFADRLRSATRSCDVIGRWGGEEFVVLLPEVSAPAVVHRRAERICAQVADEPFQVGDAAITLRVSIGAVFGDAATSSADQLLEAADRAMYWAKGAGRNQVAFTERPQLLDVSAPPDAADLAGGRLESPSLRSNATVQRLQSPDPDQCRL